MTVIQPTIEVAPGITIPVGPPTTVPVGPPTTARRAGLHGWRLHPSRTRRRRDRRRDVSRPTISPQPLAC